MLGPTLVIESRPIGSPAMVVTDLGSWLVPNPLSGPGSVFWESGSEAGRLRPIEQVVEAVGALRLAAQRVLGSAPGQLIQRAVVLAPAGLPTGFPVTDPRRGQLIGAVEAAGFTAVELLPAAAAAVWAPGSPLRAGETALVYDLTVRQGADLAGPVSFEAVLVRVGDALPEVMGQACIADWPSEPALAVELTLACCRDVLARCAVGPVSWVLPVGSGARAAGLAPAIHAGLGIAVSHLAEPELAAIRGAAAWLPRSGPRAVLARPAGGRLAPLVYTIPGGGARLLRWMVEPQQPYDEGATVARVRLAGGAIWELTARSAGILDEVLKPRGSDVRSGDWLALVRPH